MLSLLTPELSKINYISLVTIENQAAVLSVVLEEFNLSIRINAGLAKGMPLKSPPGDQTRPTSSKVRGCMEFSSMMF